MGTTLDLHLLLIYLWITIVVSIVSFKIGRRSRIVNPDSCFLCSTHRDDVEFIIAGEVGVVCSGCMRYGLAWLDNDRLNELKVPRNLSLSMIDFLSFSEKNLDDKIRESMYSVLHTIPEVNIDVFRDLLNRALVNKQANLVVSLLKRLPPDSWHESDHVNWLWANCKLEKFKDALNPMHKVPEIKDDVSGHLIVMNRIYARLNIEPLPHTEEIKDDIAKLFNILDTFEKKADLSENERNYYLGVINKNIADSYYRVEEYEKAQSHLKVAVKYRDDEMVDDFILSGDIALATGKKRTASKLYGKALKLANDDDIINAKIRNKINNIKQ